ncbi:MAG: heparinase II/III family protein [Balneolaceae bacterium]|nr:heparinase II/III family protein [Balneolaceae bacterium]
MPRSKLDKMLQINERQKDFYEVEERDLESKGNLPTRLWRWMRRRQQAVRNAMGVDEETDALQKKWMGDLSGKSVLDLGCHSGNPLSLYLARNCGSYLGVDLSESAIDILRDKLEGIAHAEARAVDFLSPEFPDRTFDVIYARSVFHHFEYFETFLEKLQGHLAPGAVVVTYDPLKTSLPVRLVRTLYRPFQSDSSWEYPFDKETFQTIQEHFEITDLRGVMGAAKWALPVGMLNVKAGRGAGEKAGRRGQETREFLTFRPLELHARHHAPGGEPQSGPLIRTIIRRLPLYYRTLRHLRPVQIRYRLWYALRARIRALVDHRLPTYYPRKGHPLDLAEGLPRPESLEEGKRFTFLNRTHDFGETVDWDHPDFGKLWTYNLNYFDFLRQPGMEKERGLELIRDFLQHREQSRTAWEPYPLSLRGMNWITFLSRHGVEDADIDGCLYAQYRALLDNLEYHILGNHLLENGCSLLFGALYFGEEEFWEPARRILREQLPEQVLADGGHFERSPMYHALVTERLLDCYDALQRNEVFEGQEKLKRLIGETAQRMGGWLQAMRWADGSLPEVNDHYPEGGPAAEEVLAYMKRLGLEPKSTSLGASGYRTYRGRRYEALADAGRMGPDYLPGHGHSDLLALWLRVDGKQILCDTGTSTYESGSRRQDERSTAAHNTVTVQGAEQNECWAAFRVGRRARPRILQESDEKLAASHDGFRRLGVEHERHFQFEEDRIVLRDMLRGGGDGARGTFHLHFPPGLALRKEGNRLKGEDFTITFSEPLSLELEPYEKALGYNRLEQATAARVRFKEELRTVITVGEET